MVSLEVEKGVLEESSCKFFIKGDNVLLFIDMEEVFKGLGKVEDEELRKFSTGDPRSIDLHSREHCDAIVIVRSNDNELIIKNVELTARQGRDLNTLLNKMNFCVAFVHTLLKRSLRLIAKKVTYVAVLVINPNDVDKIRNNIAMNRGSILNNYRWLWYYVGTEGLKVEPCGGQTCLDMLNRLFSGLIP
jgi:hypothetical protein